MMNQDREEAKSDNVWQKKIINQRKAMDQPENQHIQALKASISQIMQELDILKSKFMTKRWCLIISIKNMIASQSE